MRCVWRTFCRRRVRCGSRRRGGWHGDARRSGRCSALARSRCSPAPAPVLSISSRATLPAIEQFFFFNSSIIVFNHYLKFVFNFGFIFFFFFFFENTKKVQLCPIFSNVENLGFYLSFYYYFIFYFLCFFLHLRNGNKYK